MEVFLHLFISTLGGIFPIIKMCVFLFCSGHFSSIVLIMSFPVFFLVHLLVKVKYLDRSTVSVNSVEVPTEFFLASKFFPLLQSLLQCPRIAFSQLKKKKTSTGFCSSNFRKLLKHGTHKWHPSLLFYSLVLPIFSFLFRSLCSVCHLARTLKVYLV